MVLSKTLYEEILVQMAAEAYLERLDWSDPAALSVALRRGNNRYGYEANGFTRFADQQISEFLRDFVVLHQASDDPTIPRSAAVYYDATSILANTGLSATLIQRKGTNEYTLAIRSTEFRKASDGGDRDRDLYGADVLGITRSGLALAQLSSLEDYYSWLKSSGKLPRGAILDVTGYSLGGHLATVFTEMHANDADVALRDTYTCNGAGRGTWSANAGPADIVQYYQSVLRNPAAAGALVSSTSISLYNDAVRANAAGVGLSSLSLYSDPRYLWAQTATEMKFGLRPINPLDKGAGDLRNGAEARITQLYGNEFPKGLDVVSNTGVHGPATGVFVEAQPAVEGDLQIPAGFADWGNAHALVLIADSLAVMRAYQALDPALSLGDFNRILSAASNKSAASALTGTGEEVKAEDDALENALDSLRRLFFGSAIEPTPYQAGAGGFGDIESRNAFYDNLDALCSSDAFTTLQGNVELKSLVGLSAEEIAALAQTDAGYRYALRELNAFAIVGAPALYEQFNQQGELDLEEEGGALSDVYLTDRAAFLAYKLARNESNAPNLLVRQDIAGAAIYSDLSDQASPLSLQIINAAQARAGVADRALSEAPRFLFGGAEAQTLEGGAAADHLFGGNSGELIEGGLGDDYAEGGVGEDILYGGEGADELHGGEGADRLSGGAGNDLLFGGTEDDWLSGGNGEDWLEGGEGYDTYVHDEGDGFDQVFDSDGSGRIFYDGRQLSGSGNRIDEFSYEDEQGTRYAVIASADGTETLLINDAIAIEDFHSGDLGISLGVEPPLPRSTPPDAATDLTYSLSDQVPDGMAAREDGSGNLFPLFPLAPIFYGSNGNDLISSDSEMQWPPGFSARTGNDRISTTGHMYAEGGAGEDVIDASQETGSSVLQGGAGNDYIVGGAFSDRILGDNESLRRPTDSVVSTAVDEWQFNLAQMTYLTEEPADSRAQEAGWGALQVYTARMQIEKSCGDLLFDDVKADIEAAGWNFGSIDNFLRYILGENSSFNDYVDGGGGDDSIVGGSGSDELYGGEGSDKLYGDYGGTPYQYDLRYANLAEFFGPLAELFGEPGDDYMNGGAGDDLLVDLDAGNDVFVGGDGNDTIESVEDPLFNAATAYNYIDAGPGNDAITALGAGDEFNVILAGEGDDAIDVGWDAFVDGGLGNDSYTYEYNPRPYYIRGTREGEAHIRDEGGDDTFRSALFTNMGSTFPPDPPPGSPPFPDMPAEWQFAGSAWYGWPLQEKSVTAVTRQGDDLIFSTSPVRFLLDAVVDAKQRLVFDDWFKGPSYQIEHFGLPTYFGSQLISGEEFENWGSLQLGSEQGESLIGGAVKDQIAARGGDDYVQGGAGDDFIAGAAGDDYLDGGSGNDTYFYALGDGNDWIADAAGSDRIWFFQGISPQDVSAVNGISSIKLVVADGSIEIGKRSDGAAAIQSLVFFDGSFSGLTLPLADFVTEAPLEGSADADAITGTDGPDFLAGGPGNDLLSGGAGNDVYRFSLGDGTDYIDDLPAAGETNTVAFGPGITRGMLRPGPGTLRVGTDGDELRFLNVDPNDLFGTHDVDTFLLEDGTRLTYGEIFAQGLEIGGTDDDDILFASSANDRIAGGPGNDVLLGGAGADTYSYSVGDGADTIVEDDAGQNVVSFGVGIEPQSVTVSRTGQDLELSLLSTGDSLTLSGWFYGSSPVIERFDFADGNSWTGEEVASRLSADVPSESPPPEVIPPTDIGPSGDAGTETLAQVSNASEPAEKLTIGVEQGDGAECAVTSFVAANEPPSIALQDSEFADASVRAPRERPLVLTQEAIDRALADFGRNSASETPGTSASTARFSSAGDEDLTKEGLGVQALNPWMMGDALLQFHLSRSEPGEWDDGIAFPYGRNGLFPGLSVEAAQERIAAPSFGEAQSLRQFSGLKEGFAYLG